MKQFLQTIAGISNVAYSGKERKFYYTIVGKRKSIGFVELQKMRAEVPASYHFKLLS